MQKSPDSNQNFCSPGEQLVRRTGRPQETVQVRGTVEIALEYGLDEMKEGAKKKVILPSPLTTRRRHMNNIPWISPRRRRSCAIDSRSVDWIRIGGKVYLSVDARYFRELFRPPAASTASLGRVMATAGRLVMDILYYGIVSRPDEILMASNRAHGDPFELDAFVDG
ncbi:hypothetical protein K0M31_008382 [Melipona bicolor]|uniref:Uncharacterized protein n=1 Tax=Melipona bicolor TaxID=60889 RepID=A0AA40KKJ2_9HYME|nr:hypothetical protein K0M31_008382 [Melipona bicolor]